VINPTHDEIDFIRRLEERGGSVTLQGEIRLLKIGRLVPEYVTHTAGSSQMGHFTLTAKGWELARKISADEAGAEPKRTSGQM
jgi:O-acetyl-ADP-ribose deacetylase (regulator of RNase III)